MRISIVFLVSKRHKFHLKCTINTKSTSKHGEQRGKVMQTHIFRLHSRFLIYFLISKCYYLFFGFALGKQLKHSNNFNFWQTPAIRITEKRTIIKRKAFNYFFGENKKKHISLRVQPKKMFYKEICQCLLADNCYKSSALQTHTHTDTTFLSIAVLGIWWVCDEETKEEEKNFKRNEH